MLDHVPHPTNDKNVSLTTRFRHVLTMVLDGVRFLESWGEEAIFSRRKGWLNTCLEVPNPHRRETVGLNRPGGPKTLETREGWLKHAWRSQNLRDARRLA